MAGYKNLSEDLDSLLQARTSTAIANTGYKINGVDISSSYEPLSRDQQIPNVGYKKNNVDISELFMGNIAQYSVTSKVSSVRTTPWNTLLIHSADIVFSSTADLNNFFKYGGRIRWNTSLTGGTVNSKYNDWLSIISNVGSIELAKSNTYRNDSIVVSTIGADDLNTSNQILYSAFGTGAYSSNVLRIQAIKPNSVTITMFAYYTDTVTGGIDEQVSGTLTSVFLERKHPSQLSPNFTNVTLLTSGS